MSAFPSQLHALLQPRGYPHPVRAVELIETHISWILLTGEFAYKIKRPVLYAFIDLRSPERREFLCHEEVRLNRRFAPELYLGVSPICLHEDAARVAGEGPVIEHAVRMRQFAREDELDRLLAAGRVAPAELAAFGGELARTHAQLPRPQPDQQWGRPEQLRRVVRDNAAECARAARACGAATSPRSLQGELSRRLEAAMPRLAQRFAAGRVRECHGDLHTRNIVRCAGALRAFDCLEFDPALRWTDVADEIAFLLADLETQQRPLHAQAFLAGYLEESGDYQACALLPLFKAHRVLVRAKVAALSAAHPGALPAEMSDACGQYRSYLEGARRSLAPAAPRLVLMCGLSGSGKTWIARQLAPPLGAVHLRSDIERKRLAGLPALERAGADVAQGRYSRAATLRVYEYLAQCAGEILPGGYSVIVDATFGRREDRARMRALAARLAVPVCIVHCQAPCEVLEARIGERSRRADDPSDAGPAVLAWQQSHFEPPDASEGVPVFAVSTSEPGVLEELVQRIGAQLTVSAL